MARPVYSSLEDARRLTGSQNFWKAKKPKPVHVDLVYVVVVGVAMN
jgi:hypothetical protein